MNQGFDAGSFFKKSMRSLATDDAGALAGGKLHGRALGSDDEGFGHVAELEMNGGERNCAGR